MNRHISYFDVDLDEGSLIRRLNGLRTAYSFTPRTYLQALVQYNDQSDVLEQSAPRLAERPRPLNQSEDP